jgi:hypothetical protein
MTEGKKKAESVERGAKSKKDKTKKNIFFVL